MSVGLQRTKIKTSKNKIHKTHLKCACQQSKPSPSIKQCIFIGNFIIIAISRKKKNCHNSIAVTLAKACAVNLVIFCCHAQPLSTLLN